MRYKTIGFTCGAFDLLHAGHVLMLKEARGHCDHLIVGLHTDPSIDRPEKNKPVQSVEERRIQLEGCKYVDEIVEYDTESDLYKLLSEVLTIDVRIIGADWRGIEFTGCDLDIPVIYNSRDHEWSSSELRWRVWFSEESQIKAVAERRRIKKLGDELRYQRKPLGQ